MEQNNSVSVPQVGRARGRSRAQSETPLDVWRGRARGRGQLTVTSIFSTYPHGVDMFPRPSTSLSVAGAAALNFEDDSDDDEVEGVVTRPVVDLNAYLQDGFLDPTNIVIPALSDTIKAGDEHYCVINVMYSINEIYLIFADNFPGEVNHFIDTMGHWYSQKTRSKNRQEVMVCDNKLVPGATVVVYHKTQQEWTRAKVVEMYKTVEGKFCKVFLWDLGEYITVPSIGIVYLHKQWTKTPRWAIKAKLQLSPFYHNFLYADNPNWSNYVTKAILGAVFNKQMLVRFIRKLKQNHDTLWEVSLVGFSTNVEGFNNKRPIEQQIIVDMEGVYVNFRVGNKVEKANNDDDEST